VRVLRQPTEIIQIGGDSFQHAQHPQPVEAHKLRVNLGIGPQIHDDGFAALQSLQPINAAAQHLQFSCQAGSDRGFRLGPFGCFRSTGLRVRGSQLAQPDGDLLGFGRVEQLVDATGTQAGRARDFTDRQPGLMGGGDGPNPFGLSVAKAQVCGL